MKSDRILRIVATLLVALCLFATNIYAANMAVTTGANGVITLVGKSFNETVWAPLSPEADGSYKLNKVQEIIFTQKTRTLFLR